MTLAFAAMILYQMPHAEAERLRRFTDPSSVEQAIVLDPLHPFPYTIRAELKELKGLPALDDWALASAHAPRNPEPYIRMALHHEMAGNPHRAEQLLLTAAKLHQGWYPRWSLANFYRRNLNRDQALRWSKACAARASGDLRPLFRLMESLDISPSSMAGSMLPRNREVLLNYLKYRVLEPDATGLETLVAPLLELIPLHITGWPGLDTFPLQSWFGFHQTVTEAEQAALRAVLVRLAESRQLRKALEVQSLLASHLPGWLPAWSSLTPLTVANFFELAPDFPLGWHIPKISGVSTDFDAGRQMATLSISGSQPESSDFWLRPILLAADSSYELRAASKCAQSQNQIGLKWELRDDAGTNRSIPIPCRSEWTEIRLYFEANSTDRTFLLTLASRRVPGHTRDALEIQLKPITISSPSQPEHRALVWNWERGRQGPKFCCRNQILPAEFIAICI